jgi:hypothetical protein
LCKKFSCHPEELVAVIDAEIAQSYTNGFDDADADGDWDYE